MQCLTIIDDDVGKEFIGNKLQLMYNTWRRCLHCKRQATQFLNLKSVSNTVYKTFLKFERLPGTFY